VTAGLQPQYPVSATIQVGIHRLRAALERAEGSSLAGLCDEVIDEMLAVAEPMDDAAVVALRRR